MTKNVKKLLMILGGLVLVGLIVVILPKLKTKNTPNLSTKSAVSKTGEDPSKQFVSLLQNIKGINLDTTMVKSKAFQVLVNYNSILPTDAPKGRPNPFAQVGQDVELSPMPAKDGQVINKDQKKDDLLDLDLDSLLNGL